MKMPNRFTLGQAVRVTSQGVTADAVVVMASINSRALELRIAPTQGIPVLRDNDGVYRSLLTEDEVEIEPAPETRDELV
jgi:hypothetical protein